MLEKRLLVEKIIAQLGEELAASVRSAREAHAEATDEQCKAENKYDTRGLEASYLARGQSRLAAETQQAIQHFSELDLRAFEGDAAIDLGAVVQLEGPAESAYYFLGPRAGGMEILLESKAILVITPQSPLGSQLLGRRRGEKVQLTLGRTKTNYRIVAVT